MNSKSLTGLKVLNSEAREFEYTIAENVATLLEGGK